MATAEAPVGVLIDAVRNTRCDKFHRDMKRFAAHPVTHCDACCEAIARAVLAANEKGTTNGNR